MPDKSWFRRNKSYNISYDTDELETISSFTANLADSEDINTHYYQGIGGRRRKAAVALTIVWSSTIALHLVSWGYWVVLGLTTMIGLYTLRMVLARPLRVPEPLDIDDPESLPFVSLLVAAKNEEAVIGSLVKTLCNIDYPASRYELWVIDDNSADRTPFVLEKLANEYPQLRVMRRSPDAGGGKSGALNQVLPLTKGDIIGVFDADAQVPEDLLRRVLPLFARAQVGAVQVQKAISQAVDSNHPQSSNFWVQGQAAEMALDSFYQQQRVAIGGMAELRGNGQFVRRTALNSCGGWNEETITDDLDLTIRLHLDRWDIDFLLFPPVHEEGVTQAVGLWHQRNRWAEGGYQRYLDYWRLILRNRMGSRKTADLVVFLVTQYLMPTAAVPDLVMAIARNVPPLTAPLTSLTITLSLIGMVMGLRQTRQARLGNGKVVRAGAPQGWAAFQIVLRSLWGMLYMLHWLPVIASTTTRISFRPKRLKWVKTMHYGSDEVWLDVPEQS